MGLLADAVQGRQVTLSTTNTTNNGYDRMNTQQTESIDVIGTAETVEQAHKDARYATGYLQALYDARFITEAEYDHQAEAIKAALALRLSQLRAALLSRQSVGVSPESIRFRAAMAHLDSCQPYADGAEAETNAPWYFGNNLLTAFEAGANWQKANDDAAE